MNTITGKDIFVVDQPNNTHHKPAHYLLFLPYFVLLWQTVAEQYQFAQIGSIMEEFRSSPFFSCLNCRNPIVLRHDLLSKSFWAKSGQAYLFSGAMNIVVGEKEERKLITGNFTIAGIFCGRCGEELGWKYIRAHDPKQMYKEGNFIIEKAKILKEYSWNHNSTK